MLMKIDYQNMLYNSGNPVNSALILEIWLGGEVADRSHPIDDMYRCAPKGDDVENGIGEEQKIGLYELLFLP